MSGSPQDDAATKGVILIQQPPHTIGGILRRLGPGLIIAGSIVGSGELIATTATGAQAGFWLLWLIIIGCVIKVFVQVELGRYSIISGQTTMKGMRIVPGPTVEVTLTGAAGSRALRSNWLVFYWIAVFVASIGQLGGIVGGVGQALAISAPLTDKGRAFNQQLETETRYRVALSENEAMRKQAADPQQMARLDAETAALAALVLQRRLAYARVELEASRLNQVDSAGRDRTRSREDAAALVNRRIQQYGARPEKVFSAEGEDLADASEAFRASIRDFGRRNASDHQLWAAALAVATSVMLVVGRYGFIQSISTALVAAFTLITLVNLLALQTNATYAVTWPEIWQGLSFRFTPRSEALGVSPVWTALATFGIIGVGGNELVSYPYWCLEKGYARFTGPRDDSPQWAERAQGWLRVMRWDAWCSMAIYTFATIAFYLLGAAILHKIRLTPQGTDMIRTLAVMYEPVFGPRAQILFLFGAFAVLYSTFFVATAGHARVFPDALRVSNVLGQSEAAYRWWVRLFSGLFPLLCLLVYICFPKPTTLVLASGVMQALLLPMMSAAALYFRYRRMDQRIAPGKLWDAFLWLSALGMFITGGWLTWTMVVPGLR